MYVFIFLFFFWVYFVPETTLNASSDITISALPFKLSPAFWTTLFSFLSAVRPPTISKQSVTMETVVLPTQYRTFLRLVLVSRGDGPVLSIMQSPGLARAAKGTRRGGWKGHCVVPNRRWVFTTAPIVDSAISHCKMMIWYLVSSCSNSVWFIPLCW